jgi:glutamine amidotransferase
LEESPVSHLVAFFGNDPDRLECALFPARLALYSKTSATGWGLGFAQGGDVLLQKRPRTESAEVDFFSLARSLRADALVARAGLEEDARGAADNADPFRFRWWLFGAVGAVEGFAGVKERLLASVPDFLRRNIRGQSASEHLFHLFLAFLHDGGLLESMSAPAEGVAHALSESTAFLDRLLQSAGAPPARLAIVATNGRCLVAQGGGVPLQYLAIDGIADCTVCQERTALDGNPRRVAHEALRAVIVEADERQPSRPGWQRVADGGTLVVGPDRRPGFWTPASA